MRTFAESDRGLLYERDARLAVLLCVLVGLIPASQQYMVRFTRANLRALEPSLSRGTEVLELRRPGFWQCIVPGILMAPAIAYGIDRDLGFYLQADYLTTIHAFQWGVGFFCTINIALSTHLSLVCAGALAKRAEAIPRIDLLDLSSLAPFARQSLQTLLVWLLMLSIFSVNAADPAGFFLPIVAMSILCLGNAVLAALRCNRTVHFRIREAKRDEKQRVNAALRGDASALSGLSLGVRSEGAGVSASDLLAYRRFVEESREWAFDTSAWLRTAFYLAIPLGSWLGGALVERALEASLR